MVSLRFNLNFPKHYEEDRGKAKVGVTLNCETYFNLHTILTKSQTYGLTSAVKKVEISGLRGNFR